MTAAEYEKELNLNPISYGPLAPKRNKKYGTWLRTYCPATFESFLDSYNVVVDELSNDPERNECRQLQDEIIECIDSMGLGADCVRLSQDMPADITGFKLRHTLYMSYKNELRNVLHNLKARTM